MNCNLPAEQDMIVRSLRAFREQELEPHEAEVDRSGEVPDELDQHIKQKALEVGFYAPNLPQEIGGGGLDYKTLALFERELGKRRIS
jgi:acyl-CoA dehydrogenase